MILANILWKNGMDLNKNVLTSMNVLGTDSNYLSENEAFLNFFQEAKKICFKEVKFYMTIILEAMEWILSDPLLTISNKMA